MENQHKYSLALVGKDGQSVIVNFGNYPQHTLPEIYSFTFGFNSLLSLKHHLAHTPGRIDNFFRNKYAHLLKDKSNEKSRVNSEYNMKCQKEVVSFSMADTTRIVILDEFGNEMNVFLPFSSQNPHNKAELKNPISYFEKIITSKLNAPDGYDYLVGFSTCINEKLSSLGQLGITSAVLEDKLQAIKTFTECIDIFKSDNNATLPSATIDFEGLHSLLNRIFSTPAITQPGAEISHDALDWEIIIAVLQYDAVVTQAKKEGSTITCTEIWQINRGSRIPPIKSNGSKKEGPRPRRPW